MTIKEIIEAVKAGELNIAEYPAYFDRLFTHLETLRDNQKTAPQQEMANYEYEITNLENLLESAIR